MIQVQEITDRDKDKAKNFADSEWGRFNNEKGYSYKDEKYVYIALLDGKMAGYLNFKINGGAAFLSELIVLKELRHQRIGENLIKKFEEIAKNKKCHIAYLETSEKHNGALKFYKKYGYKKAATLKNNKSHLKWYFLEKELK